MKAFPSGLMYCIWRYSLTFYIAASVINATVNLIWDYRIFKNIWKQIKTNCNKVKRYVELSHTSAATKKCCRYVLDCSILSNIIICGFILRRNKSLKLSLIKQPWIGMACKCPYTHSHATSGFPTEGVRWAGRPSLHAYENFNPSLLSDAPLTFVPPKKTESPSFMFSPAYSPPLSQTTYLL